MNSNLNGQAQRGGGDGMFGNEAVGYTFNYLPQQQQQQQQQQQGGGGYRYAASRGGVPTNQPLGQYGSTQTTTTTTPTTGYYPPDQQTGQGYYNPNPVAPDLTHQTTHHRPNPNPNPSQTQSRIASVNVNVNATSAGNKRAKPLDEEDEYDDEYEDIDDDGGVVGGMSAANGRARA